MTASTAMHAQYARESLEQVRAAGIERLLKRHWAEIAHFKDIPLAVDWPAYEAAEGNGGLRLFTVRMVEELLGYACYLVRANPHYLSSVQAVQDVLFIAPECRKARLGAELLRYSEGELAGEGVEVIYQHSKVAHPMDALLRRLGYEQIETTWAKRLNRS
ncbi:MAG: GNAT family N-acetyltransferase [Steroidobacteraceae bacterium]